MNITTLTGTVLNSSNTIVSSPMMYRVPTKKLLAVEKAQNGKRIVQTHPKMLHPHRILENSSIGFYLIEATSILLQGLSKGKEGMKLTLTR
ncbi:hypothetical protein PCANC_04435 [Puccinia coronata f. sp. avenae]|uniref:Uncharacterized protein n=1 Tax=Puccinia coronata f. sp. avenae TaxID=200324 RepID=A0A2N5VUS6_9BASI|nr:hypothetical protein PCANC_04435 [Puccinia coronata f. sp. avenae]